MLSVRLLYRNVIRTHVFVAGALCVLGAGSARADDGGIENVGGAVRLLSNHSHVRMVSEVVTARVSASRVAVDCEFVFFNDGPADSVLIGFPDESSGDGANGRPPMTVFQSWVDGEPLACVSVPDADSLNGIQTYQRWWTKKVFFPALATRTIRDHYEAKPGSDFIGMQHFRYILATGASWKGTIGSAEIHVMLEEISPRWLDLVTPGYTRSDRTLTWSLKEFEPGSADGSPASIDFSWYDPKVKRNHQKQVRRWAREERAQEDRYREAEKAGHTE